MSSLRQPRVGLLRFPSQRPLGRTLSQCRLIVLVLAPAYEKGTKTAREIAKTLATLLADASIFGQLLSAADEHTFKTLSACWSTTTISFVIVSFVIICFVQKRLSFRPFRGILDDVRRKADCYLSDYRDGVADGRSVRKVLSAAVFLVFSLLPTSIAYGMLNDAGTRGLVNVQKVVLGQCLGGLFFGLVGGQQLLILSTTAPLSIYIQVIYQISLSLDVDFYPLYAWVGIWAQVLLMAYAIFNVADLMKFTKRSTEEVFGLFIAFALVFKSCSAVVSAYTINTAGCNGTSTSAELSDDCSPGASLLFVLMALGTLWLALSFDAARKGRYTTALIRDLLSDYALPLAVLVMAALAKLFFPFVAQQSFQLYEFADVEWARPEALPARSQGLAVALAVPLSLLFFMDQLLVTNTVDNRQHRLRKGSSPHWDLLVVAVLNVCLSLLSLPWMHGALPSAFLHLKALADVEHRIHDGVLQDVIVHVRETRLAAILAHALMIPFYFFLIPHFMQFIPTSLFHGLFLFMAVSSLTGNEMWQRVLLFFTEQKAYPACGFLRKVPQRIVHTFTLVELFQLGVLILVGFYPWHYVEMAFPVVIALFIPFRIFAGAFGGA